jgi:hypothetical protein
VDLRGIGPLTPPCHGGVLPVYHRPLVDLPRIELGTAQCECAGIPFTYKPVESILRAQKELNYFSILNTKYKIPNTSLTFELKPYILQVVLMVSVPQFFLN